MSLQDLGDQKARHEVDRDDAIEKAKAKVGREEWEPATGQVWATLALVHQLKADAIEREINCLARSS